jgi:hypothetical protein
MVGMLAHTISFPFALSSSIMILTIAFCFLLLQYSKV